MLLLVVFSSKHLYQINPSLYIYAQSSVLQYRPPPIHQAQTPNNNNYIIYSIAVKQCQYNMYGKCYIVLYCIEDRGVNHIKYFISVNKLLQKAKIVKFSPFKVYIIYNMYNMYSILLGRDMTNLVPYFYISYTIISTRFSYCEYVIITTITIYMCIVQYLIIMKALKC